MDDKTSLKEAWSCY